MPVFSTLFIKHRKGNENICLGTFTMTKQILMIYSCVDMFKNTYINATYII